MGVRRFPLACNTIDINLLILATPRPVTPGHTVYPKKHSLPVCTTLVQLRVVKQTDSLFTCWNVDIEGEKVSHDLSYYLAHVEIQLLGRNAQHCCHEATGDIDGHNLLVGALGPDDGLADQTLLHDLRRREYFDRKLLNPVRIFTPF